jgi:hypothetical protein
MELKRSSRGQGAASRSAMVQFPSRKSEMLTVVRERPSKTADVPSPMGDWALIPTQIDAG